MGSNVREIKGWIEEFVLGKRRLKARYKYVKMQLMQNCYSNTPYRNKDRDRGPNSELLTSGLAG